jgi:hypothetical protein
MESPIDQAETASETICEVCGTAGSLMLDGGNGGWPKTLWDDCARGTSIARRDSRGHSLLRLRLAAGSEPNPT